MPCEWVLDVVRCVSILGSFVLAVYGVPSFWSKSLISFSSGLTRQSLLRMIGGGYYMPSPLSQPFVDSYVCYLTKIVVQAVKL